MSDIIVLIWVAFIFLATVFFSILALVYLLLHKKVVFAKGFVSALSVSLLSVLLCLCIWPPAHRIYYDEVIYMSQSVNIISSGKANSLLKGSRLHTEISAPWEDNPKLPGFAWLEAVELFFSRGFDLSLYISNLILGAMSAAVLYRLIWLWTGSYAVSCWSAVFWACLPVRIVYSMSAASDISGAFFCLLFFLFLSEYGTLNDWRIMYAALFNGVYSICIKPFYGIYVLLGLVLFLYVYHRDGLLDKKTLDGILWDIICLFLPLLSAAPVFFFTDSMARGYSLSYMPVNLHTDILYLFNFKHMTPLATAAAVLAVLTSLFYKRDPKIDWCAGWLLVGILITAIFYAGGFSYPGIAYSDRYFIPLAFPFVFLAARGTVYLLEKAGVKLWRVLFFVLLFINALTAAHHLDREAKTHFFYVKTLLLKKALAFVPDDAYVLDACAAVETSIGLKKAIDMRYFLAGDHPKKIVVFAGTADEIYNPRSSEEIMMLKRVLKVEYQCTPLIKEPLKEEYFKTIPYLCTHR